jgi:hypothetical protein
MLRQLSKAEPVPDFIPPHPPRLPKAPPTWRRVMLGRRNFLAMWEEEAFD